MQAFEKSHKETHLILLWNNALNQNQKIFEDIKNKFFIKDVISITWSQENFLQNIKRFYGVKISEIAEGKVKEIGFGEFLLYVVEDTNPVYKWMETSRGTEKVNKNLFDVKALYRKWTGGGHKIHTTNSEKETIHDFTLLLGKTPQDYFKEKPIKWNGHINSYLDDLVGANGWKNLEQLFYVLNFTTNYLVMRNFEILPNKFASLEHGDIDLIVEDYLEIELIMNATKVFNLDYRVHCKTRISNEDVLFDLRFIGDGYYDYNFQQEILKNKRLERGFFRPSNRDYFFSLVYHALIHKEFIANDYFIKCRNLFIHLFGKEEIDNLSNHQCFDVYYNKLMLFMNKNNYSFTVPSDKSVYFDEKLVSSSKLEHLLKKRFPIKDLKLCNVSRKSGSGFFNYTGYIDEKKVFIKMEGLADSVKREYYSLKLLHNINPKYFPKPYFYRYNQSEKIFISSFENGLSLEAIINFEKKYDFEKISSQIKDIAFILNKEKIIHRDIKPDNFIIDSNSNVKLVDFQYVISNDISAFKQSGEMDNVSSHLKLLGEDYRFDFMHWDDAYSFSKVLEFLNKSISSKKIEQDIRSINNKIGDLSFKLNYDNSHEIHIQNLNNEIQGLKNQINILDEQILAIKNSTSWKITRPIRLIKNIIRFISINKN